MFTYIRFQLVALQIKELQDCYSEAALEEQIRSLPRGLDIVYDRIIFEIPRKHRDDVLNFLHWLAFSARPLLLEELAQIVGVVSDTSCGFRFKSSRVYRDPRFVLNACASLVTLADGKVNCSFERPLVHQRCRDHQACSHVCERLSPLKGPRSRRPPIPYQRQGCSRLHSSNMLGLSPAIRRANYVNTSHQSTVSAC
jgi:hypothetical protein